MMYIHPEGQKVDQYLFAPPSIFCQKYCLFWIQSISAYKVELFFFLIFFNFIFFNSLHKKHVYLFVWAFFTRPQDSQG